MNWSHSKPEYSGKPEEDSEAQLLRRNDWMETHTFPGMVKVQRLCLTLVGGARLWYESLRLIAVDWNGLQDQIRQQYSKKETHKNSYFMHGVHFIMMRIWKH